MLQRDQHSIHAVQESSEPHIGCQAHLCGLPLPCRWSLRVIEEFFAQGDREKEEGLPVTPLCDRLTTSLPASQINFLEFIVAPLFLQACTNPYLQQCSVRRQEYPKVQTADVILASPCPEAAELPNPLRYALTPLGSSTQWTPGNLCHPSSTFCCALRHLSSRLLFGSAISGR